MKKLYELREKLCEQLETYAGMDITANTLDVVDKLTHALKNLDKIIEADEYEYSERGYSRTYGMSRRYDDGHDFAHDMDRGMSNARRRDSRGRYSMHSDKHEMVEELRDLMEQAPENTKGEFKRFIERVEMM